MARLSRRWEREFRRIGAAARRFGLAEVEVARLVADLRERVTEARAAGLADREVTVMLTSDGAGSVAMFVGDPFSVLAAAAEREAAVRTAMPSRAVH